MSATVLTIFDDDQCNPTLDSDASGLLLEGVSIGLVLFKPTATNDNSSYYALSASANVIKLIGLDLGGSGFSSNLQNQQLQPGN